MRASPVGPFLAFLGIMLGPALVVAQTAQVAPAPAQGSSASARARELVWTNAEVGVMHLELTMPDDREPWTVIETGIVAGAGVGLRFGFLTIGFRLRAAPLHQVDILTSGLEAGIRAPLGALEPYLTLGAGYLRFGAFNGVDVRLSIGADYYLTKLFSIGMNAGGDRLFAMRPPGARDGTGYAVTGTAVAGLHF